MIARNQVQPLPVFAAPSGAGRWMRTSPTSAAPPMASPPCRWADGQQKWCAPLDTGTDPKVSYSAAVTAIPGVLIVGGSDGKLWALSSDDGHTLWKYQTAMPFQTVNGVPAHGGSIVSAGATVAAGMVLVGSGYGVVAEAPGNVLLAFSLQ